MDLFSRPTVSYHCDRYGYPPGSRSCAVASLSQGLYLAAIVGIILTLAMGSILAVQLRPCITPPAKSLSGHSNQPRLVDTIDALNTTIFDGKGGESYGQVA